MAKRLFQIVATAVLILAAFMPLVECFDRWDSSATTPSNDTELRLMVAFTGIGALLVLGKLAQRGPDLVLRRSRISPGRKAVSQARAAVFARIEPEPSPPPLPLRI